MAQFVLQENSDGSVSFIQKKQVLAEICGKVISTNPKNNKLFNIHAEKMDKKFRCLLTYNNPFCPVRDGDAIFGVAEYVQDPRFGDTLNIIQPPFVMLGEDKNTIMNNFVQALRGTGFGTMKAHELIELMITKFGSLSNGINELDILSSDFNYKNLNDDTILDPYCGILKKPQMLKLLEWWYKNRNLRRLWLLGINNTEIRNAKKAPEELYQICLDNPYKISSLPLEKCDDIASRLGKETSPEIRKCAEISRKLNEYTEKGWTGIPSKILVTMFPDISKYVPKLREMFDIKTELHTVYLAYPHEVEIGITDFVCNLLDSPQLPHAIYPAEITYTRNDLSPDQKIAVEKALSENICIVRGAAGTGKTAIIKEMVHNLKEKGVKYEIVSFTGKAVARIREVIEEKEPMTMNMSITLAGKLKKGEQKFHHLIIDEASMVTSELLYEFVKKYGSNYRVTLIGDPNQLTPISFGTMFDQIIKSGVVPTYTLTRCHRIISKNNNNDQDDENDNGILINASNIVECAAPDYNGPPFAFEETDTFNILDGNLTMVKDLIKILQNNGVPNSKITIICPFNKYLNEINKICQELYNDIKRSVRDEKGISWRIGDRVMMTENNYKINAMNGDEGTITDLSNDKIQVTFKDGTAHVFDLDNNTPSNNDNNNSDQNVEKHVTPEEEINNRKPLTTNSLVHSYGVSVHRYQGSESEYVILYIPESAPSKFLNRNLLYTGITRARKIIWMVGHYETMLKAATTAPPYRCDNLALRLREARKITISSSN